MKSMYCLSVALLFISFSALPIHAADVNLSEGWNPVSAWGPGSFAPGYAVQWVRTTGTLADVRAFVKLSGYNEVCITDITTTMGKELYASALSAMTSGTKVAIYITTVQGVQTLTGIGVTGI
jgi:hypothetical protein